MCNKLFRNLTRALAALNVSIVDEAFRSNAIRDTVRSIGLTPTKLRTSEGNSIYGVEAKYRVNSFNLKTGLWQIPQQFECLLQHIRRSGIVPRRTLTVGTWSGWTDVIIVAYLSLLAKTRVLHDTYDINDGVSPCIRQLFANSMHVNGFSKINRHYEFCLYLIRLSKV